MRFVSAVRNTNGLDQADFFLLDSEDHILFSFPTFNGNTRGMLEAIKAVSFKDVNQDGYADIIIIADYIIKTGSQSVVPFPIADIYFQQPNHRFTALPSLDDEINEKGHNQTLHDVIQYVSKQRVTVH